MESNLRLHLLLRLDRSPSGKLCSFTSLTRHALGTARGLISAMMGSRRGRRARSRIALGLPDGGLHRLAQRGLLALRLMRGAISGHRMQLVAIRGHQWPSVAI